MDEVAIEIGSLYKIVYTDNNNKVLQWIMRDAEERRYEFFVGDLLMPINYELELIFLLSKHGVVRENIYHLSHRVREKSIIKVS